MGGDFSCMCDVDAEGNIAEKVKGEVKLRVELKNENKEWERSWKCKKLFGV